MRWERLFEDLEAQLEAAEAAELAGEVAERTRRELALVRLQDRLRAARGVRVCCYVQGAEPVSAVVLDAGTNWLLLGEWAGEVLVALDAVVGVTGLGPAAAVPGAEGEVARRLDLRWGLRGLARDRAALTVALRDGSRLTGTLDRVGADWVELAEHGLDEPRRTDRVVGRRVVPLVALALLRSGGAAGTTR